jgi:sulfate adenylyltransferase subunit 1 (EFTu-like GTPase family)
MDLVDYQEEVFEKIQHDFNHFSDKLDIRDIYFIPISALKGDNVVDRSQHMNWYQGPTLMYSLEHLHISKIRTLSIRGSCKALSTEDRRITIIAVTRMQVSSSGESYHIAWIYSRINH